MAFRIAAFVVVPVAGLVMAVWPGIATGNERSAVQGAVMTVVIACVCYAASLRKAAGFRVNRSQ